MAAFKGIRYARAERFGSPVMEDLPSGTPQGEISVCPQPESRLGGIHGPGDPSNPLSEDCLRLSIFTPDKDDAPHPVIVWICGGSFITGSGLFARYDGTTLSHDCGAVVVCVSYRVGALGFLPGEGMRPGLQDQICALQWVRKHIRRFGGDPERVTVCAQSAGAYSLALLISTMKEPLFSKAILFSAPLGLKMNLRDGARVRQLFEDRLGMPAESASFKEILDAQEFTVKSWHGYVPFMPAGVNPFPHGKAFPGLGKVLLCCQIDDAATYVHKLPAVIRGITTKVVTWIVFRRPMMHYARALRRCGVDVETRVFGWRPEGSALGACHTLELPLLFGNREYWKTADMLQNVSEDEYERRGHQFRREISAIINDQ